MSPVENLLDHLEKVGSNGSGWRARCPAHEDDNPSLSVSETSDGTVLVTCHAGCDVAAVVGAVGMELKDLFPPKTPRRIVATYDYTDENGQLLSQVVRYDPRDFYNRRPGGPGEPEWIWKLGDTRRVLYRLPEVLAERDHVWIMEGEKDVDAAVGKGLTATTNLGGAGSWRDSYAASLDHVAKVTVVADRDDTGRAHARTMAASIRARGKVGTVEVVQPPEGCKDFSDMLAKGLTRDALEPVPEPEADASKPPGDYRLVDPSTVEPRALEWLWQYRIPTGTITVLAGPGGVGKGVLWVELVALVTTGNLDGDLKGQPIPVLILTAEERIADVIGPRLRAAGADLSRVRVMTMSDGDYDRDATFPDDLPKVREAIDETGARLVVIDPLNAHLADRIDSHKDAPLRRALGPLTRLAGDSGAAVVGIAHTNKGTGDAVNRVLGSVGYVNAARSVLIVGRPPDSQEGADRVVAMPKSNNAPNVPSLRFRLEGRQIPGILADRSRGEIEVVGLTWVGEDASTAEDLLDTAEDRTALGEAIDWLSEELSNGPRSKSDLSKAARAVGIAERTLQRARKHLRAVVERDDSQQGRPSTWRMPGFMPPPFGIKPLAQNQNGADQGEQDEFEGFVPTPGDGTKPPSQCLKCGLSDGRHGTACPLLPEPFEVRP